MANSYTQIHIQFVFAVKYRAALIGNDWKERLYQYITGIFQENKHKMLQINSMPDHIHIFAGMRPHQSISTLIQNVKTESSKWIKTQGFCSQPFAWQEGYGAFSIGVSQAPATIAYIEKQKEHHRRKSFQEEFLAFLEKHGLVYDPRYVWG